MAMLVFASLTVGLLAILLLSVYGVRVQRNNLWLIGYLISLSYSCWIGYLMETRQIYHLPHLIRTGTVLGYLIVPLLYIYVRSTCYPGQIWKNGYIIAFIPSIFFIIDLIPFWISSGADKIRVFESSMYSLRSLHAFAEGWIFPNGWHFIFRIVWSFIWFTGIVTLMYRNRKIISRPINPDNKSVFRFMLGLTALSFPFMIIHLMLVFFFREVYTVSNFTVLLALPLFLVGGYLMFSPKVVYGFQPPRPIHKHQTDQSLPSEEGLSTEGLQIFQKTFSSEDCLDYLQYETQLLDFMKKEKPYLQQGITIHQLSDASGIPTYIVSLLLNRHFGQSFNNWINGFRIDAFTQKLLLPESKSFTMEALGKSVGFGSRVTLIKAFKKHTGQTPGQFLKHKGGVDWSDLG